MSTETTGAGVVIDDEPTIMVGSRRLPSRYFLAPLAGYTHLAFRRMIRELGGVGLATTDLVQASTLLSGRQKAMDLIETSPEDRPLSVQIFSGRTDELVRAAVWLADHGYKGIDINMGCPAKKIVHSQHGSALMKDPDTACRIIESIRNNCGLQVSVKTRLGWKNEDGLIDFCRSLQSAGTSMITIHGRTYSQAFKGVANWEPIYELKNHLQIPLLGNGDVLDYQDGMKRLENLDGFMIGRHAIGNPWCFQDSKKYPQPVLGERIRVALDHYGLLCKIQPERVVVREFRKYLGHYVNGFQHAKAWRARLMECESSPEFVACMNRLQQEEGLLQLAS